MRFFVADNQGRIRFRKQLGFDHIVCHRDGDFPESYCVDGVIAYAKNSLHHREQGPALILQNGTKIYYKYGYWQSTDEK